MDYEELEYRHIWASEHLRGRPLDALPVRTNGWNKLRFLEIMGVVVRILERIVHEIFEGRSGKDLVIVCS